MCVFICSTHSGPAPTSVFQGNTTSPDLKQLTGLIRTVNMKAGDLSKYEFHGKQYKFLRVLGKGTYAVVQEAEWLPKGERVAVKMIAKRSLVGQEEALHAELEILSRVQHPNLLKFLDWGFGSSTIYIVTELYRSRGTHPMYCIVSIR
jgi:calcium/calmodulin-dependent protein kinase I